MPLWLCTRCGGSLQQVHRDGGFVYLCPICGSEYDEIPDGKKKPSKEED
jgi:predicted RNA-binding Zn-ribbon protein involved in translation (DUF1610 family)